MNEEKKSDAKHEIKKFNNGWTQELESLAADWTDRAQCYRWMHDKSSKDLARYNQYMMIPVIILSTLSGTANFGLDTIFPDPTSYNKKVATLGIGSISIITGIISTLVNFFRYAQLSESHSVAAISWAKFARLIIIELSLHPNERSDAQSFLKMFRIELDRLIEQSPIIPEFIVMRFQKEFDTKIDIKRPDITGDIQHTHVYNNRDERLKQVAAEAALSLIHKKKLMKDLVLTDIDKRIHQIVDSKPFSIVPQRRASIQANNTVAYVPQTKDTKEEISNLRKGVVFDIKRTIAKQIEENKEKHKEKTIVKRADLIQPVTEEPNVRTDLEVVIKDTPTIHTIQTEKIE